MGILKNLIIGLSVLTVGGCETLNRNSTTEDIRNHQHVNIERRIQELEDQRMDNLQKLMNNVVQIRMKAKEKRNFLTMTDISRQIGKKVRRRTNNRYHGKKTEKIISDLLSKTMKSINMKIASSNTREDLERVGTGFVYKTCRGDVLLTNRHLLSPDKHSYTTPYGNVLVDTEIKAKRVFYNGGKINLEKLIILNEPDSDLIITRLPDNFGKKTYYVGLARGRELKSGSRVIKMGNTFGEGIQVSSGVIGYNGTRKKIVLGRKMNLHPLSLPVAKGDSGSPALSERNLRFIGTITGVDPVKDNLSVPMRAYVLPWKQSIGKLKEIEPYNECSYD